MIYIAEVVQQHYADQFINIAEYESCEEYLPAIIVTATYPLRINLSRPAHLLLRRPSVTGAEAGLRGSVVAELCQGVHCASGRPAFDQRSSAAL